MKGLNGLRLLWADSDHRKTAPLGSSDQESKRRTHSFPSKVRRELAPVKRNAIGMDR